jgi:hypothetical protein
MRAMQTVNCWSSRTREVFAICVSLAGFLFANLPALAQDSSQTTMTGTVVSYSNNTMVVKGEGNQYKLFVFDRHTVKPDTLADGSGVRVVSTQTEDPEVRLALLVTAAEPPAPPPGAPATPAQPDVVPTSIRTAESAIERDARKFHFGFQAGMALDPEGLDIGIHAKFGPFFSRNIQFRPSVDFGYGEITKLFALNGDFIYNLSANPGARKSVYFGIGPQFNFVEQSTSGHGVDFSEFHYSNALNILFGLRLRSGVFTELKTSVYASPAPILRLLAGYTF